MRTFMLSFILGVLIMAGLWEIVVPFAADDINEATNPSLEYATTGWSTAGTLVQSTSWQYRGRYSGRLEVPASTTLASYAITLASQNSTYYVKIRLLVTAIWDTGADISLNISGFTGGTATVVKRYTHGTDPINTWLELVTRITVGTDVTGSITLVSSATPALSDLIHFDALYASKNNGEYFDGDDDMAFWVGDRHASKSRMDFRNRLHGEAVNLDSYNVFCGHPIGFDFTPPVLNTRARALSDGEEYLSIYTPARVGQLPITLVGTSEANYHSRKKAFEDAVKHNRTPTTQPFILKYLGANARVPAHLQARLNSDLNLARSGFSGIGALRVLATDPAFYEMGDNHVALTRSTNLNVSYILGWLNDGTGFSNLGNTGTGTVLALALAENGDLYVGGDYLNWDGIANADHLARYNRSTNSWSALFTPANDRVQELLFLDDGDLIIGGNFTSIGGSAINRLARWNGATISGFGTGMDAPVLTAAYDYQRGIIYFGGSFTTANGVTVNFITRYTLATGAFTAMDSGVNGAVLDIEVDDATGDVFVGGSFTTAGAAATTVNNIVKWDYSDQAWRIIGRTGTAGVNNFVRSLKISRGRVYLGGDFTAATGASLNLNYLGYINIGDLKRVRPLGPGNAAGVNNTVYRINSEPGTRRLIISGNFTQTTAGLIADRAVVWNGSSFEPLGLDFPGSPIVYAFALDKSGDYYYGFSTTGTMIVPSALNTITYTGTTETYPIFFFESLGATIGSAQARLDIIANRTTGKQINFNGLNLIEGTLVIIDTFAQKVYRISGQTQVDITGSVIRRDSDWSNFTIVPGVNEIMISAPDVTGTPAIEAYMLYRRRHHSLSGTAQ